MSDTITVPPGDDTTTSSPSDPDSMRVAAVFGSEIPDFTITGPLDPDAVAAVYGDRYRTARLGEFSYVESDGGEEWAVSQCWLIAPDVPNDGVVDAINTAARMWMANTKDFDGLGAAEETMFAAVEEIPVRWFWEAGVIPAHRPAVQIEDLSDGYINPNGSWMDEDLTKLLEEN